MNGRELLRRSAKLRNPDTDEHWDGDPEKKVESQDRDQPYPLIPFLFCPQPPETKRRDEDNRSDIHQPEFLPHQVQDWTIRPITRSKKQQTGNAQNLRQSARLRLLSRRGSDYEVGTFFRTCRRMFCTHCGPLMDIYCPIKIACHHWLGTHGIELLSGLDETRESCGGRRSNDLSGGNTPSQSPQIFRGVNIRPWFNNGDAHSRSLQPCHHLRESIRLTPCDA